MDFSSILQDLLTTSTEAQRELTTTTTASSSNTRMNKKLCLLLSHGLAIHEIFFTECIHQFLQKHYPTLTIQPYGDKQNNNSDVQPNIDDSMIKNYIKNKVDKLLKPSSSSSSCSEGEVAPMKSTVDQNVGIFIDNLTALYDLGVSVRELENMLSSWWWGWCCSQSIVAVNASLIKPSSSPSLSFMHIGIHLGDNFEDSIISEYEPAFVHFIDMWRRRASNVIEVKPLTTGYTSLIDGQVIYLYCPFIASSLNLFFFMFIS
ncbi:unnamed protein product [Trichobilharzia regenti]|nr:unnamed protein product [Trichobilharzia regenti]